MILELAVILEVDCIEPPINIFLLVSPITPTLIFPEVNKLPFKLILHGSIWFNVLLKIILDVLIVPVVIRLETYKLHNELGLKSFNLRKISLISLPSWFKLNALNAPLTDKA